MNRRRKIVIGITACFFAVSILVIAAVLVAPKVIASEAVKAKLRSEIKETAGVEIDFKHLGIDIFPHPAVIIDRVDLSIPRVVRGKAAWVAVQPKVPNKCMVHHK